EQAEPERLRRGRLQRPGRRQRASLGPLRASPPGLTGSRGGGAGGPQVLRWTFPERAPWGRPDSRAHTGARAMVRTFGTGRTWVCGRRAPRRAATSGHGDGAGAEIRTRTPLRAAVFKTAASAVPPLRRPASVA